MRAEIAVRSPLEAPPFAGAWAALCYDKVSARNSREHNHANVLIPGGLPLIQTRPETCGSRYAARAEKTTELKKANFQWTPKS